MVASLESDSWANSRKNTGNSLLVLVCKVCLVLGLLLNVGGVSGRSEYRFLLKGVTGLFGSVLTDCR